MSARPPRDPAECPRRAGPRRRLALVCLALVAASCATYSDRTRDARESAQRGDLPGAEKQLNKLLGARRSQDVPTKWKKDTALALLERGMVLHARGAYKLSARDLSLAEKQLELLDIARDGAGQLGKYVFSDSATKYKAPPSEKLVLNAFNLLNYLLQGDLSGARVEAKRFTIMHDYLTEYDAAHPHGAFGSYLAGFVFERLGEHDRALRYYDEALQARPFPSLDGPIRRLAALTTFRSPHIDAVLGGTPGHVPPSMPEETTAPPAPSAASLAPVLAAPDGPTRRASHLDGAEGRVLTSMSGGSPDPRPLGGPRLDPVLAAAPALPARRLDAGFSALSQEPAEAPADPPAPAAAQPAEILVVAAVGRVPFKVPERMPIGAAVGLAHNYITGDASLLMRSALKVVIYPELVPSSALFERAELRLDGQPVALDLASDIQGEILQEYEDVRPKIIGAAISRLIVRAAVAEAARAAGNSSKKGGALIGLFAALAAEAALVAADRPDTRSWTLLPALVFVARLSVSPGPHTVTVAAMGPGGTELHESSVDLTSGGFSVIDVTTLR